MKNPEFRNRVLIADDQKFNIITLRYFFEKEFHLSGKQVVYVKDGREAIEEYGKSLDEWSKGTGRPYSLLILDFAMPHKNGLEVVEQVKRLHEIFVKDNFAFTPDEFAESEPYLVMQATINEDRSFVKRATNIGVH